MIEKYEKKSENVLKNKEKEYKEIKHPDKKEKEEQAEEKDNYIDKEQESKSLSK